MAEFESDDATEEFDTGELESLEARRREEQRPLEEAGEGEAEGFELAEAELIEHASHGDQAPDPTHLAGKPEDPAAADAEYGEADHEESSEVEDQD
jgi:hypothetical protein